MNLLLKHISFYLLLLFVCTLLFFSCTLRARKPLPDDLVYQQRILLIFTPRQGLPAYQQEEEMYVNNIEGLAARDVEVYRLFRRTGLNPENERLNAGLVFSLRTKHQVDEDAFVNILVGKDGKVKLRKEGILPPEALFAFLDTLYQ